MKNIFKYKPRNIFKKIKKVLKHISNSLEFITTKSTLEDYNEMNFDTHKDEIKEDYVSQAHITEKNDKYGKNIINPEEVYKINIINPKGYANRTYTGIIGKNQSSKENGFTIDDILSRYGVNQKLESTLNNKIKRNYDIHYQGNQTIIKKKKSKLGYIIKKEGNIFTIEDLRNYYSRNLMPTDEDPNVKSLTGGSKDFLKAVNYQK